MKRFELVKILVDCQKEAYLAARSDKKTDHPEGVTVLDNVFDLILKHTDRYIASQLQQDKPATEGKECDKTLTEQFTGGVREGFDIKKEEPKEVEFFVIDEYIPTSKAVDPVNSFTVGTKYMTKEKAESMKVLLTELMKLDSEIITRAIRRFDYISKAHGCGYPCCDDCAYIDRDLKLLKEIRKARKDYEGEKS